MALAQHAELPEEQHMGMGVNNAAREGKNQGSAQHAESSEGNAELTGGALRDIIKHTVNIIQHH